MILWTGIGTLPQTLNLCREAVELRRAAMVFGIQALDESLDDNDSAGRKSNRQLLAAALKFAKVANG